MAFLTPTALLVGLLSIPIVLLYMLRLRRREIVVSSNMLWQQLLQDREANTPWQRLRRSLLLILQLLILALLTLALARPYVSVPAVSAGKITVIIDASASMNATDVPNGTRLDDAKRRALEIIDTMSADDRMTVIRAAAAPQVVIGYTGDRAALRAAVESVEASSESADWNAALTLAAAGALGESAADAMSVVIISDGGVGRAADLPPIPGAVRYIPIGQSGDNLALSALAARAQPGQPPQLFAQIVNHSDQDADAIFSLRIDGALVSAERLTIPASGSLPIVSAALPAGFSYVEAALTRPSDSSFVDHLPTDDRAYALAPQTGARRALVMTDGNLFLEQVLRTIPGIQPFRGNPALGLPGTGYDLYVFDGWQPPDLPTDGDLLIINPTASTPLFEVGGLIEMSGAIRVQRGDPRMTFVDFSAVNLLRYKSVRAPWADALIEADSGALLLAGEAAGQQIALLTFDLRDSDLPLQIAFPVLMASLMEWYAPPSLIEGAETAFRPGSSLALRLPPNADALRVTLPDGTRRELTPASAPVFAETGQIGLYRVEALRAGVPVELALFAVNLFDPNESAIAPRPELTLGGTVISQAQAVEEIGQRELWSLLALIGLVVLLIEWWVYHRRSRMMPAPARWSQKAPAARRF
jgi:hypothetical protein